MWSRLMMFHSVEEVAKHKLEQITVLDSPFRLGKTSIHSPDSFIKNVIEEKEQNQIDR